MTLKKAILLSAMCLFFIISGCGDSTSDKIYNHLEEAVNLEDDFVKQQNPITELEKQEQEIYNQIIDLGMDEFDKIKQLSQEAIKIIDERAEILKSEKASIEASKEEFMETEKLIEKLKDQSVKEKADNMYATMMKRYDTYNTLHSAYGESLKLEKELYSLLQREDTDQQELTDHINSINDSYEKVFEANDKFNAYTAEYNEMKKEFYKAANMDVAYEDEAAKKSDDDK